MSEKDNNQFEYQRANNLSENDVEVSFSSLMEELSGNNKKDDDNGFEDFFDSMKVIYEDTDAVEPLPDSDFSKYLEEESIEDDDDDEEEEADFSSYLIASENENVDVIAEDIPRENVDMASLTNAMDSYFSDNYKNTAESNPVNSVQKSNVVKVNRNATSKSAPVNGPGKKHKHVKGELKKPLTGGQLAYKVALIVCIFVMVCSLSYIAYKYLISALIENHLSGTLSNSRITDTDEAELRKRFLELQAQYPDVVFPEGIIPSLWTPYAENQDNIGWLKIDGLDIDYPVVQTSDKDTESYYLRRDFYSKSYSTAGTLFLTSKATINPASKNLVIFGHRMKNGTMFGKFKKYKTIDGFKEAPLVEFDTLYEESDWKIYAVFLTNALDSSDNGYTFNYTVTGFSDDAKFISFIGELDQRKLYSTGVDINKNDTILTLSTCDYDFTEARLVVVARKVRAGESSDIDTELAFAKAEADIRYPQEWYDKNGKTNPYKNALKWMP